MTPDRSRGRFLTGLAQSLGIFVLGLVVIGVAFVDTPRYRPHASAVVAQASVALTVIMSLVLGFWHLGHKRGRSAAGVFTGTVLWLAIGFVAFAMMVVAAMSHMSVPW